jgi:hypothetical protein
MGSRPDRGRCPGAQAPDPGRGGPGRNRGARVAMETVTSEAKKTTTAVDETGKKLEETGARAQSGAGAAKTALEGTGPRPKRQPPPQQTPGKAGGDRSPGEIRGSRGHPSHHSIEDAYRRLGMRSTSDLRQEARPPSPHIVRYGNPLPHQTETRKWRMPGCGIPSGRCGRRWPAPV